jgi:hypothetical protein
MEINDVSARMMVIDEAVFTVREVPSWVRPIMSFLVDGHLLEQGAEARRIQRRSKAYTIINNKM